jgi:hypothetical protein
MKVAAPQQSEGSVPMSDQSDNGSPGDGQRMGGRGGGGDGRPGPFTLRFDAWGRLVFSGADGVEHVGVEPVRAFPISGPGYGISLCNAEGHEVLWAERLEDLPPAERRLMEEELARREFLPVVRRIVRISTVALPAEWEVETDRGRTRFVLNSEDDVRRFDEHRAVVTDAHGVRYLIPDTRTLDAGSRRVLERYL